MIALSVLLIIVGVVMAATSICQLVAGRKELDDDLAMGDIVPYIIKFSIEIVRLCIANIGTLTDVAIYHRLLLV